jgi:hypothetical protein
VPGAEGIEVKTTSPARLRLKYAELRPFAGGATPIVQRQQPDGTQALVTVTRDQDVIEWQAAPGTYRLRNAPK